MHVRSIYILMTIAGGGMMAGVQAGVVGNVHDSGSGSLRQAIADAARGERITIAPHFDGARIALTSGQLTIDKDLSIDASALAVPVTLHASQAPTP